MMFRRRRYATIVMSLLSMVLVGIATVVSLMTVTTFRPLPFANPESLVWTMPWIDGDPDVWQADTLAMTARLVPQIAEMAALSPTSSGDVAIGAVTRTASYVETSPNYFRVLRLQLDQGNAASTYATTPGSALITRQLAAKLGIAARDRLGKTIRLNDRPVTIVGVVDRTNGFPADADLWVSDMRQTGRNWLGVGRTSGPADISALGHRLSLAFHQVVGPDKRARVVVRPLAEVARPAMATEQRGLIAGIVVFAIIAILNYALLGIGEARRRAQEFAIRVALGATRRQVAWQFLVEQLRLIGAAVLAAGVLFMIARALFPTNDVFLPSIKLVPGSIWLMMAAALGILILAATLPSQVASNRGEAETLRQVSARSSRFERTWNRSFIGTQFAVTAFLLVAGGAAALSFLRARNTTYGFDPTNALIGTISFKTAGLQGDGPAKQAALETAEELQRAMPGARSTVWGTTYLAMPTDRTPVYMIDGPHPPPRKGGNFPFMSQDVMPGFFNVIGIPILIGRQFRETDDETAERVVIVSELAARRIWGSTNVIGKRLFFRPDGARWMTVVGVVANAQPVHDLALQFRASATEWRYIAMYRPLKQYPPHSLAGPRFRFDNTGRNVGSQTGMSVLVRPGPKAENVAASVSAIVGKTAPGEKFAFIGPLPRFLDGSGEIERGRFTTNLLLAFTVGGFGLAIFGAICLVDEVVRSRTNEIGIRRALGAPSASLVVLASRETFLAGMTGVIAGVFAGARLGAIVAVWLKGSRAGPAANHSDVNWVLVGSAATTLIVLLAVFTAWRAARAARLDPMVALRAS